eukprot:1841446-Lingulodinium_polyedra.AAC.1
MHETQLGIRPGLVQSSPHARWQSLELGRDAAVLLVLSQDDKSVQLPRFRAARSARAWLAT